ncbi:hypothetical protein IE53DRAFT_178224 [Violaceomyces palustris]|uniref:Uncharacterized protein n=1 Tax=Violaceomyces palustris TaxID=1673888 RepID=A0ACD0NSI4_9BASI|nr:hypothetical protein IE53DRAFT_178224 [Violaceomyces palustris]
MLSFHRTPVHALWTSPPPPQKKKDFHECQSNPSSEVESFPTFPYPSPGLAPSAARKKKKNVKGFEREVGPVFRWNGFLSVAPRRVFGLRGRKEEGCMRHGEFKGAGPLSEMKRCISISLSLPLLEIKELRTTAFPSHSRETVPVKREGGSKKNKTKV